MKRARRRSKFEATVGKGLPNGTKYENKRVPYVKKHVYVIDYELPNGVILEVKGKFTASDRAKHKLIKEQHPELDVRFVFMRDNTLNKNSDTTYSEWATKYGFPWCIGPKVPKQWLQKT